MTDNPPVENLTQEPLAPFKIKRQSHMPFLLDGLRAVQHVPLSEEEAGYRDFLQDLLVQNSGVGVLLSQAITEDEATWTKTYEGIKGDEGRVRGLPEGVREFFTDYDFGAESFREALLPERIDLPAKFVMGLLATSGKELQPLRVQVFEAIINEMRNEIGTFNSFPEMAEDLLTMHGKEPKLVENMMEGMLERMDLKSVTELFRDAGTLMDKVLEPREDVARGKERIWNWTRQGKLGHILSRKRNLLGEHVWYYATLVDIFWYTLQRAKKVREFLGEDKGVRELASDKAKVDELRQGVEDLLEERGLQ